MSRERLVAVFGSSEPGEGDPLYEEARQVGALLAGLGYGVVTGGYGGVSSAEIYDPITATWSPTGSMPEARAYHAATLLPNGKVLVGAFGSSTVPLLYDYTLGVFSPAPMTLVAQTYPFTSLLPNGSVLDVTLHPSAVRGEEGLAALVGLIRAFLMRGGYAVQFNVLDAETLRDAQRYPERYSTLQVRVTGWSVYFTSLTKLEQDQYIARIAHGL